LTRKKIQGEHRKKRGDSQNGKGTDIVLRERAVFKVLGDDRKEKGRRRMAFLIYYSHLCHSHGLPMSAICTHSAARPTLTFFGPMTRDL